MIVTCIDPRGWENILEKDQKYRAERLPCFALRIFTEHGVFIFSARRFQ